MLNSDKAKQILNLLSAHVRLLARDRLRVEINAAGGRAMMEEWRRQNPDDGVGGMSGNPYGPPDPATVDAAILAHENAMEVMDFAVDHFLSMIPRDDSELPKGTIRCPGCDSLAFRRKNNTVVAHYTGRGDKCAVSETVVATVFTR